MIYKRKKLNIGKEEIGKIQEEIDEKNKDNIQKNASPIISIVTPYYNGQDYIDETAKSVLCQTFTNFEWIIVDDGSSKEGIEKLKEIEKLDDRIRVIFLKNELATNVRPC